MTKPLTIRRMKEPEVQIAIDWAKNEGWNPGIHDAHSFFLADPHGFFIGSVDDKPIAVASGVNYDQDNAFFGLYIVKPEFRNQGYGMQLTQEILNYFGNRMTGLDGVVDKVSEYERLGYVRAYTQNRFAYSGDTSSFTPLSRIIDLRLLHFTYFEQFDRRFFPSMRSNFLRNWITQKGSYALGYLKDLKLEGYGVIRKCYEGYKIGPLFAESPQVAHALFEALVSKVKNGPIFLDIPEVNENAQSLVREYDLTPKFQVVRMYRNGSPVIELNGVYGNTTFELG